jgi:hypothetical protein
MDHSKGEASSEIVPEKLTPVAANSPDYDERSHNIDTVDAFKEAISRQAAARAARFADRPPLADDARQQAMRELDLQERRSRLSPFKLVLEVFIGAVIFGYRFRRQAHCQIRRRCGPHVLQLPQSLYCVNCGCESETDRLRCN